ncbi:hypothetical protein BC828DRAFT_391983 [Blastocladiella britannica]|nr:hypothetical protein BC828DRAFT_391983 [Blastocladiella britannica]
MTISENVVESGSVGPMYAHQQSSDLMAPSSDSLTRKRTPFSAALASLLRWVEIQPSMVSSRVKSNALCHFDAYDHSISIDAAQAARESHSKIGVCPCRVTASMKVSASVSDQSRRPGVLGPLSRHSSSTVGRSPQAPAAASVFGSVSKRR